MPTTDRYVLNELQQATLDVMAANVMPGDDEDLSRSAMTREEIIAGVQAVPGQDEVNGNHMGPTLHCLKRRGLVKEASWPAKGKFHITPMGITYVDLDGEPEAEEQSLAEKRMVGHHWPKVSPEVPREGRAEVTHIDPETRRVVLDEHERKAGEVMAPPPETARFAIAIDDWQPAEVDEPEAPQAPSPGASSTACDDQHRPEPVEPDAELEAALLATRDAIVGMELALEEMDEARAAACGDCGKDLTAEEVTYYGYQCEACVWADHKAMQTDMEEGAASEAQPEPAILARFDDLAELNASYKAAHAAPASRAPEVTILSVAVHPPGTAWLDNDATVMIKLMDEGSGPYLDISSWDGPAAIESLEMLEAVTNTARNLLREAEAREVAS